MKRLIERRNAMKAKKPRFLRQDAHKVHSLAKNWRRPTGVHSSLRRKFRGDPKMPSIGYSSPKKVRGLTRDGFKQTVIFTLQDLEKVNGACILGSAVGARKKVQLLKRAQELKVKVLNIKDSVAFIKAVEESFKKKKEKIKTREEKKKKSKEEALKKADDKEKTAKEEDSEAKEKQEKEIKRKVLEQQ